jgi:hypothetical protein
MGYPSRRVPGLARRSLAAAVALSIAGPWPALASDLRDAVASASVPAAAPRLASGVPPASSLFDAYQELARLLSSNPPPAAGLLRAQARALRAASGRPGVDSWLASRLESALDGLDDAAVPQADVLAQAQGGLDELKGILEQAPPADRVHPGDKVRADARSMAASLAGAAPADLDAAAAPGPGLGGRIAPPPTPAPVAAPPSTALSDQDKLDQRTDLQQPSQNAAELAALDQLSQQYKDMLTGPGSQAPGLTESKELKWAALDALNQLFNEIKPNYPSDDPAAGHALAGTPQEKEVADEVAKIETLKSSVQAQLAARDALAGLLAVSDKARDQALQQRRNGADMLEFRKNFSRLAAVVDMSLALNEISAAEKAIAGMQNLLQARLAAIQSSQQQNQQNLAAANAMAGQLSQWTAQAQTTIASDQASQQDMVTNETEAASAVQHFTSFQTDVSALIASINASDRGQSADAATEYQRRINLLPQVVAWRTNGNPSNPNAFSVAGFQTLLSQVNGYISTAQNGLQQMPTVPVEFAGVLIALVPGPSVTLNSPSKAQILQLLSDRKTYWTQQAASIQSDFTTVNNMMNPANTATTTDEFGNVTPQSLPVYRQQQQALLSQVQTQAQSYLTQIDQLAADVNQKLGAGLPPLSSLPLAQLQTALQSYASQVVAVTIPSQDTPAIHAGTMDILGIADLLPRAAHDVILWSEASATISSINSAMTNTLPVTQAKLGELVQMFQNILADDAADVAFINGTSGESNQALINRKTKLLQVQILPPLNDAQALLQNVLIPYQQTSIASAEPGTGALSTLFSSELTLINQTISLYNQTVPWAIATHGGAYGNAGDSHAHIAAWRAELQNNLNGYKDASGNQVEGLLQYQTEIKERQDPNYTGTETVYGEVQPYSLPRKVSQYTQEMVTRAGQINTNDAQINQILSQIQTLSNGKYNLQSFQLPVGVTPDAGGVAKVQSAVNAGTITNLASQLTSIGNSAASSGGISIPVGGGTGSVPVGTQPPITITNGQKIALLALDAARRLAPSSLQQQNPDESSSSYAIARFLYANAVVTAAQSALTTQIPPAQKFVGDGVKAIGDAVNDTLINDAYVNANGQNETPAHVYTREIASYQELDTFLREAMSFFGLKTTWDQGSISTINQIGTYYSSMQTIYQGGQSTNSGEVQADQTMMTSLQNTLTSLQASQQNLNSWLSQLNDPHESALRRVMENIDTIQDKTRAVLEANLDFHKLTDQYTAAQKSLQDSLNSLSSEQAVLSKKLESVGDLRQLSPELAQRVQAVSGQGSSWLASGAGGPQTLIIPKSQFSTFLNQLFGSMSADSTSRDIASLSAQILQNPMALAQLLPNSKMVEVGQGSDGFYLVYQTDFSSPGGLETSSQLTLGNVLNIGGNNISLTGYKFESPPTDANAPFGDQGISVDVESLQGKNSVNYLDVTFHKFLNDSPSQPTLGSQVGQDRMMVFDDYALMLCNGKLYFGAAGFADFAAQNAAQNPYYYGGNLKASVKFSQIMSLNAEESALFVKDPRQFLQNVNLDFTGFNPDLNQNFPITASGDNKFYNQDKVGLSFDLAKALQDKNAFKVDFYISRITGTDDINQDAIGTTIVKGFSFDVAGTTVNTTFSGTGELGQQYNTLAGQASFELPKQGIVLSGQGKMMGDTETYFVELKKKLGANTDAFISYGSQYIGLENRLTIGTQTTFTLGQLWQLVAGGAAKDLQGGQTLQKFNQSLDDFFKKGQADDKLIAELKRVYDSDVGKKLISLEIGQMTKNLQELLKAGAILDNTKMQGMIGFVTNPVASDPASLATGGGFQVGTQTSMTMTKSQKEVIHNSILAIYQEGLALQTRLLDLTKQWQGALVDLVESRWDMSLAAWMYANADDPVIKADAQTRALDAADRHRQALLRYNSLTGRGPDDTAVIDSLSPQDLDGFCDLLRRALGRPDRLAQLIGSMRGQMDVPQPGFNLMDWIPIFEKISFSLGTQLQDLLASQALTVGVTLTLPIYDPTSKTNDKALKFQDKAIIDEMAASYRDFALKAAQEKELAGSWDAQFTLLQQQSPQVRQDLSDGIRQWRNGLISQSEMWARFRRWYWLVSTQLTARAQAALKDAWSIMDAGSAAMKTPVTRTTAPANLAQGFDAALQNSPSWDALAQRSAAAQELTEEASHRFQSVSADIVIGSNLTSTGLALLPAFGITGLAAFPIFNVALQPEELKELSVDRRGAEAQTYSRLHDKVGGDLALQLFQGYSAYRSSQESLEVYRSQIIPELEQGQDGSSQKAMALDQARLRAQALAGDAAQAQSQLNYLLGQPLSAPITLGDSLDTALVELKERLGKADPLDASRDVLTSRVKVAQSVEQIVDKNLTVQTIRVEPISLIGRSLGRLISALSGDGLASPELVALAREQTLTAQANLRAFDAQLPVLRSRWAYDLAAAERELKSLDGRADGQSRLRAIELQNQIYGLKANLLAYGGQETHSDDGVMPVSFADLKDRLETAMRAETGGPDTGQVQSPVSQEAPFESQGTLRYYDALETLGSTPIGKQYLEGWIEVRLRSPATPPEALVALAKLQQEKADQLTRTELAQAQAQADILLSRIRLEAVLARQSDPAMAASARQSLERDFTQVAAHLRLPSSVTLDQFLRLLPADQNGVDGAVDEYLRQAQDADLDLLKRQLFQEGLPEAIAAAQDPLSQMQANLIAEKMSYKGFTPVAAFGMFQGKWVGGAFLEAPDPAKIQKTLEGILNDALRKELESQDRMKGLSLMLHALMASVADKVKLIEAERSRVEVTQRNLSGAVERLRMHMGTAQDAAAAETEAAAAHEQFIQTVYALRLDFIRLVTELEALGYSGQAPLGGSKVSIGGAPSATSELTARQELLAYWAQRLLDPDFERSQDGLLSGLPQAQRDELRKELEAYRQSSSNHDALMGKDFSPQEKFDLLTKVDLDGRRIKVESTLDLILKEIEAQGVGGTAQWTQLMGFLRTDVENQSVSAEGDVHQQEGELRGLRDAFWGAVPAPPKVEAAYQRLSQLKDAVYDARQEALHHYLEQKLKPEDYVLKDKALEAYVKALIAYDNEVLKDFAMPDVGQDPRWSTALNALFGLAPSLDRRRDMLRYGRGIVTMDAAINLGDIRLEALRAMSEARDQIEPAAESLAFLRQMRDRWIAKPETIPALYELKGGDQPSWLTSADLKWLSDRGQVVDVDGHRYLLPPTFVGAKPTTSEEAQKAGGQEILAGEDARRDELEALKRQAAARRARVEIDQALQKSELALSYESGEKAGGLSQTLSLVELRRLESQGKVLYFNAGPDPREGLRLSVHPLAARWRSPEEIVVMVQVSGDALPAGTFPSLEALEASDYAGLFRRAQFGKLGVEALLDEAGRDEVQASRSGWLDLKLQGFAYALDKDGQMAAVYMSQEELGKAKERAKDAKSLEHAWTFHLAADLRLGLDADGLVVSASDAGFSLKLGGGAALTWLDGDIWALELDAQGRVARVFHSQKELEQEAGSWWIEDMEGHIWKQTDKNISPIERLKRYIDPKTGLPVILGRPILAQRLSGAQKGLGANGRWAYMPWNWGNIVLELPRGIIKDPVEMITGRDPNQEGYIGNVYMRQTDGGATIHRGTLGKIAHAIDIFEILPDPVDRYYDPSQFPSRVNNASPITPGEWEHQKSPETVDGKKNVVLGNGALLREVGWAKEDLEDARGQIMGSFQGSVRRSFVEQVRGRAGEYAETKVDHQVGRVAVEATLNQIGDHTGADGNGALSAAPDSIGVDTVQIAVQVGLGAAQQEQRKKVYQEYLKKLQAQPAPPPTPDYDRLIAQAELALAQSEEARLALRAAADASLPRAGLPGFPVVPRLYAMAALGR